MSLQIDWKKGGGLAPAIVQHADTGEVLMLGYMNAKALDETQEKGLVTFWSRSKERLWTKGETSGNTLTLVSVAIHCALQLQLPQALLPRRLERIPHHPQPLQPRPLALAQPAARSQERRAV